MALNLAKEIAVLQRLTVKQLRTRYAETFGEATLAGNKVWLLRRIAWRLQALAEGDLSERARQRAAELVRDADLRLSPPRPSQGVPTPVPVGVAQAASVATAAETLANGSPAAPRAAPSDPRLPPPGSVLSRTYQGRLVQVRVLADGFEFEGEVFPSLSAAAKAVCGCHCNGFLFFKLTGRRPKPAKEAMA